MKKKYNPEIVRSKEIHTYLNENQLILLDKHIEKFKYKGRSSFILEAILDKIEKDSSRVFFIRLYQEYHTALLDHQE
jgi:hypothetical protein